MGNFFQQVGHKSLGGGNVLPPSLILGVPEATEEQDFGVVPLCSWCFQSLILVRVEPPEHPQVRRE